MTEDPLPQTRASASNQQKAALVNKNTATTTGAPIKSLPNKLVSSSRTSAATANNNHKQSSKKATSGKDKEAVNSDDAAAKVRTTCIV